MDELLVVIPALKKRVAFPDDLVKKLDGVTLIQRTIQIGLSLVPTSQILVITDSEEINLICQRQDVASYFDSGLRLPERTISPLDIVTCLDAYCGQWSHLMMLSPYAPLLTSEILRTAYEHYGANDAEYLVPVIRLHANQFTPWPATLTEKLQTKGNIQIVESAVFSITCRVLLEGEIDRKVQPLAFPLDEAPLEIRNYQDWWICEKLLNRRRIVFRVIGYNAVGMGHIYRCLALAHEISDHEVYFVCDSESVIAATKIAGYDYWLGVYSPEAIEQAIIDLKPNLVVNDILNTDECYILRLKENGVSVVNYEDLGNGAVEADITINDLYDEPLFPGDRILWGHNWFFLRDEFQDASPNEFQNRVNRLLITFGGTDPSDFTRRVLSLVALYCADEGITIDVVTGDGYGYIQELQTLIASLSATVTYTHTTGVISRIMENTQLAICSNGRTVYELAHMNIPAVVLSHHARELSHRFACEENGFLPLDIPNGPKLDPAILSAFRKLVVDSAYRKMLFNNMKNHSFIGNKHKVVEQLQNLLCKAK